MILQISFKDSPWLAFLKFSLEHSTASSKNFKVPILPISSLQNKISHGTCFIYLNVFSLTLGH